MKKLIATHNGIMHADEITAVALLKIFSKDDIVVERVAHQTEDFTKYDMVIDISKKFDGKRYFDHHQYKGGKSSAGLLWDYMGVNANYPKLSKLIKLIDDNDVGIEKAKEFEYSALMQCFNTKDIYSKQQDKSFLEAVEFSIKILNNIMDMEDEKVLAKDIVKNFFIFDNNKKIIELSEYTKHWNSYINGNLTPHIKAVVWEDVNEKDYKVMITPKFAGSFELTTKAFTQDDTMKFVHSAGFFAIAKDEEIMKAFLKKQIL